MSTQVARQFWIRSPGHGEIVTAPIPPRQGDDVLVRTLFTGISRGTESLVYRGEVPPSQYQAMRAPFQDGDFPGPVKYGYASVGRVVDGPADRVGELVFCLYPHQDVYAVPSDAAVRLPDGVPPERAVLAANVETALNALWDGRPSAGARVVVIGAGVVGLLTAWQYAREPDVRVLVHDIDARRAGVAAALGIDFTDDAREGADADLVVHASGQPAGLRTALDVAGRDATVLELSWYGDREVCLPLGEDFHARRLTIKSSQVGGIPPHKRAEWTHRRRLEAALALLTDDRLDALISDESDFDELPAVLDRLSRNSGGTLCHRIRYPTHDSEKGA